MLVRAVAQHETDEGMPHEAHFLRAEARGGTGELQAHTEIEAGRLESEGLSPADAARLARQAFGSRALVAELTRDSWGARWLTGVRQDPGYALRPGRRTAAS